MTVGLLTLLALYLGATQIRAWRTRRPVRITFRVGSGPP